MTALNSTIRNNFNNFFNDGTAIEFIYEDEQCVAYDATKDRQAPEHFLVVPKKVIPRLSEASTEDERILGHLLIIAKDIAIQKGLDRTGYHVVVDEDHRTVRFKAVHVFGRTLLHMLWPTGPGCRL